MESFNLMRAAAWDMYASAALSMSLHPGTTRDKAIPKTAEEIAQIADDLLAQRDLRFEDISELGILRSELYKLYMEKNATST